MDELQEEETMTLSGRIETIFSLLGKNFRRELGRWSGFCGSDFISKRQFCLICGLPRFDQDVSGMTCGNQRCLCELKSKFERLEENSAKMLDTLEDIAKILDLKIGDSVEKLCEDIKNEIQKIRDALEAIEKSQTKKAS